MQSFLKSFLYFHLLHRTLLLKQLKIFKIYFYKENSFLEQILIKLLIIQLIIFFCINKIKLNFDIFINKMRKFLFYY